jgi:hypothetical protein
MDQSIEAWEAARHKFAEASEEITGGDQVRTRLAGRFCVVYECA